MGTQQSSTGRVASNGRALPTSPTIVPSDAAEHASARMARGLDAGAGMPGDASARMALDASAGTDASAGMHRSAVAYALRHGLALGRYGEGHGGATGLYFLRCPVTLAESAISMQPTAASALAMMRRALRCGQAERVTR